MALPSINELVSRSPRLFQWGRLVGVTGGAQVVIQGIGFVCGILILRILSTDQYAFYTLANTMLGTMTVLADGGISSGVMAEGGKKWLDRRELGVIIATGMHMRRQFAVLSLLVSLPILYYLLQQQESAIWWQSVLLILCLTPAFFAALSGSLLQIVPKLHQDINELLKINVGINVIRLVITVPVLLMFPFAGLAILAAGIGQIGGNIQLRKLTLAKADWKSAVSTDYRRKIMTVVKRILPGSIYYCVSGQITVWLIAIFSSTESVAQIGALGRLMMVLTLFRMSIEMLVVPRYARLPAVRDLIVSRFFQVLGLVSVLCIAIIGAVYLLPDLFLWVLGNKYDDLQYEIVIMTISSCLLLISGIAYMMASSRGIIPSPYLFIGSTIASEVLILAFLVDYTTLAGVLWFSVYSALFNIGYRMVDFLYQTYRKMDWSEEAAAH